MRPNPLGQAVGRFAPGIHRRQGLHECLATGEAAPAPGIDVDTRALAVGRHVADDLLVAAVAAKGVRSAGAAVPRRVRNLDHDVVVVVSFLDPDHPVVGDVQDVCRYMLKAP